MVYNLESSLDSRQVKECWDEVKKIQVSRIFHNYGKKIQFETIDFKIVDTSKKQVTTKLITDNKIAVGLTKYIFDFYIDILDKVYQEIIKSQKKLNKDLGEEYEKSWEFTKRQYNTYIIEAMKNFFGEYESDKLTDSNTIGEDVTYKYTGKVGTRVEKYKPEGDYILSMSGTSTEYNKVNQYETQKRIIEFLNIKSEKSACGAPLQKLELFRCTLKESMSYLNVIEQSKEVLIKFLKKKIEFITSGVEVSYVKEKKDQIEIMLNRIAMASSISLKDKARLDLVKKIVSEYEMYLNLSINYEKNLTASSSTGKLRKKLKNVGNIDYEIATATKIHYELKALALRYTFILTYRIMKDLYNRMGVVVDYGENIEKEMEVAFKLIDENIKKQANVNISIEKAGLIKKIRFKTTNNIIN